jgi:hypothetical protein
MILNCSAAKGIQLEDADNFRSFKIVVTGQIDTQSLARQGVTFVDDRNALVAFDLVPTIADRKDNDKWLAGYGAMIEAAKKYGWIDEKYRAIRAHVERP